MVLGLDGEVPLALDQGQSLGNRPRDQHPVTLQPKVVVKARGVVPLDHEAVPQRGRRTPCRLRRRLEVAHVQVLAELGVAGPSDRFLAPGGSRPRLHSWGRASAGLHCRVTGTNLRFGKAARRFHRPGRAVTVALPSVATNVHPVGFGVGRRWLTFDPDGLEGRGDVLWRFEDASEGILSPFETRPDGGDGEVLRADLTRLHLLDRKSTRLNSSHITISYAVFCLKKKKKITNHHPHVINISHSIA